MVSDKTQVWWEDYDETFMSDPNLFCCVSDSAAAFLQCWNTCAQRKRFFLGSVVQQAERWRWSCRGNNSAKDRALWLSAKKIKSRLLILMLWGTDHYLWWKGRIALLGILYHIAYASRVTLYLIPGIRPQPRAETEKRCKRSHHKLTSWSLCPSVHVVGLQTLAFASKSRSLDMLTISQCWFSPVFLLEWTVGCIYSSFIHLLPHLCYQIFCPSLKALQLALAESLMDHFPSGK